MGALPRAMAAAAAALIVLLAGCGGGSGSGPSVRPPPPPPVAPPPPVNIAGVPVPEPGDVRRNGSGSAALRCARRSGGIRTLDRRATGRGAVTAAAVRAGGAAESDSRRVQHPPAQQAAASTSGFRTSLHGDDQLRQRVAWALSQIMVVSQVALGKSYPFGLADYYDMLARDAFGDFRTADART